jgi:putative acetyltransferase
VNIRPELHDDAGAVRDSLIAAFGGAAEAGLVECLRRCGDLALALVADDGAIRGFAAFPRLTVEDGQGTRSALGLAPLAVMPDRQRRGIGVALVREGHRLLAAQGHSLVFVLGDPAYYTRFGYDLAAAAPFESAYAGPHFMALRLNESAPRRGKLRYPAAFTGLG